VRKLLNFSIFFLLTLSSLNAQDKVFKFFNLKDGLPSNNIFKIRFDQKGFLWIAHDKGISRYDGNTFKNYNNPNQKSNVYTDLYIGPDNTVWMTNLGLQVYYIQNDEMKLFRSFDLKYPSNILRIAFLSDGNMLFNAQGGLVEINPRTKEEHTTFLGSPIQGFVQNGNKVHFMNFKGNYLYTYNNKQIDSIKLNGENKFPPIFYNGSVLLGSYNNINQLLSYSFKSKKLLIPINLKFNYNYSEQIDNNLILFTTKNIYKIKINGDSISSEIINSKHNFTHYAKDKIGNEWYATLNEGLLFIPAGKLSRLGNNIEDPFLRLIQFNNKAFCITQSNVLYKIEKNKLIKIGDFNRYLDEKPIILIKNLQNKRLVIGNSKFFFLDSNLNQHDYFPELAIKDIAIDKGENVFLATSNTIYKQLNTRDATMRIVKNKKINGLDDIIFRYPINGRFNCVGYDTLNSTFYFGGVPGFFMQKKNETIVQIKDKGEPIYTTIIDYLNPFVYVGTIQSGIYILKDGKIISHLNSINSNIGNTIIKIKHDGDYVWVLSEKGIHNINIKTLKILSYSNIGSVNLSNCSDFTINDKELYLISGQNLYAVDLNEFIKSIAPVEMYFRTIQCGENTIYNFEKLVFKPSENSFTISIDVPAASVLGNVEFEYTLDNSKWYLLNKGQTDIYLNQLSPGMYKLSIRQKGLSQIKSIEFTIESPYWVSKWFYALILLSLGLLAIVIYKYRVNNIREKSKSEIEKFKLEKALQQNILSSIKSQMNPHFLFNALNTIQSYIYLNDKKQAINYLGKFSVLTRKILDQSNNETITLSEEYETLDLYLQLEKMRFEDTFEYSIVFENIPFKDQFRVMPMLIQPYVENAIKHGLMHKNNKRYLEIKFKHNELKNNIEVRVEDNGVGRKIANEINEKRPQKHSSFSSEANKTRLEILNKDSKNNISVIIIDKTDQFGNATGTLVQINIPVL
jgi:hypothetical protein